MQAVILAGGLGTRLRPLTHTRPKHLLPVANRPHIDHVFDLLQRHGINDVVVTTSYLADAFQAVVDRATARGLNVAVTHEAEPRGTAGALKNAADRLDGGGFLVFNGDVLTDLDLTQVVDFHRDRGAMATIVLTAVDDPSAYGVVPTRGDGEVVGFIEKPSPGEAPTNLINAGVYVFEDEVLDRIPADGSYSAERQLFPSLVGRGLYAVASEAYWMDIGTPAKYLQANLDALSGRYPTHGVGSPGADASVIDATAEVAGDARLSSVCVGAGATVAAGASVERSVLLPDAVIGAGARLVGTILGEGAHVAAGATVRDETVADGDAIGG